MTSWQSVNFTVAAPGYRWITLPVLWAEPGSLCLTHRKSRRRILTTGIPVHTHVDVRFIDVTSQDPYLFRRFATLPHTEEAINDFANQWGLLGIGREIELPCPPPELTGRGYGEIYDDWIREMVLMSDMVDLMEVEQTHDTRDDIKHIITRQLRRRTQGEARWDDEAQRWSVGFAAPTLLGLLWLQCINVLTQSVQFYHCAGCGQWFTGEYRSDTKYCSNACKQRAARRRAKETPTSPDE